MRRLHADAMAYEPSARVFETAITGAAPGAGTAAAQVAPEGVGRATAGLNSYLQSLTPNILKSAIAGAGGSYNVPGPGLVPSPRDLAAAAARDPTVRAIYMDELQREAPRQQSGPMDDVMRVAQGLPGASLITRAMSAAGARPLTPPPPSQTLEQRVFNRLTRLNAGPELQFQQEHPWLAATAQIPGEAVHMAPALGAAAATGGLGLLPSATAFDLASQAQRINIGGQEGYEEGQGAVNILSMLTGGLATRAVGNRLIATGTEEAVARRAAAMAGNAAMTAVPTAVQAGEGLVRKAATGEPFDTQGLLTSLYKGIGEAGLLSSMPHLAPGSHDIYSREELARERAATFVGGPKELHDTLSKMEEASKGKEPEAPIAAPEDHSNVVNAFESAQDAMLQAAKSEAERRTSREALRDLTKRATAPEPKMGDPWDIGQQGGPPPGFGVTNEGFLAPVHEDILAEDKPALDAAYKAREDRVTLDAIRVLEREMRKEPPGSAKRLDLGSERGIKSLADQFGISSDENLKILRERGADLILEPHRKSETQGGFARVRTTPEERAELEREQQAYNREHQRVSAEAPERLRQLVNRVFTRVTGRKAPLIAHVDPGLRAHQIQSGIEFRDMAVQDRITYRKIQDLYQLAPPENYRTMDKIFTMAADDPAMESVALANLPEAMRPAFSEALREYHDLEVRHGEKGLEVGALPQSVHEERGFEPVEDMHGVVTYRPTKELVATKAGGKYEGTGKLVGGFDRFSGQWVHHDFGTKLREKLPKWMGGKQRTSNELERIQQADVPSSFMRRTKTRQQWLAEGNVAIDPSFHEMSRQRQAFRLRSDLNYLRDERKDLYRTKSDIEGDIESQGAIDRARAAERLPKNKIEFAKHKAYMEKEGIPIFAGESGPLTKEMQESRAKLSKKLHAQIERMNARKIPFFGDPENFHPDDPMYKRRLKELRREQATYALLQKQFWTHLDLENPETWMGVKVHMDQKTIDANTKLRELFDERLMLENALNSTWVELKGRAKYGDHAGNYVNSNALREIEVNHDAAETAPSIFLELSKTFKFMRVPANFIRSFSMQFTGNTLTTMMGGVQMTPAGFREWMTATEHIFKYLWSQGKVDIGDPIFQEMLNRGRITGQLALYDVPHVLKEQVFSALEEARRELDSGSIGDAARNYIAAALRAMRYYPSQAPIFGRGIQLVSAMDLIPQYAMLRQLVTGHGSIMGKMDMDTALTHTGYLFDMNSVPRWVEAMAQNRKWYKFWPTFVRWLYKGTVGPLQWMMASPPTVGTYGLPGLRLPQFFGKKIAEMEGTPEATKYVWYSKAINLALNAAKFVTHLGAAANLSARMAGFDPSSEEFKRRKLAVTGGDRVRAFLLLTIGDHDGEPVFHDPTNLTPLTAPFTLGTAPDERNNDSAASRGVHWLLSLNWLLNATSHIIESKDFAGRDVELSQAVIESMKNFVPGALEMPATAAWNASRPWSRKTLGEAMFQSFSGMTIRPSSPLDDEAMRMRELSQSGDIEYIRNPIPTTVEGKIGLRFHNLSPAIRRLQMDRQLERMGR